MTESLTQRDQKCIWHPYTPISAQSAGPIAIVKGKGAWLYDENGKKYLDVISSWWVNIHGHAHPYIAGKIAAQLHTLEQVIFAGFTHEPAITLAERILELLPGEFSRVFFSDDGSTAVEVALKMALQYWYNQGVKKTRILAFQHAYHGDTFGAMAASSRSIFTRPFDPLLFEVRRIDPPLPGKESDALAQLEYEIKHHRDTLAAFIFEPLVLGAGGMLMYDAEPLDNMLLLCRQNDIVTIADEVMTGFGRTGTLFAIQRLQQKPDLICLSKGITGGFMPLGLTACSEKIFHAFRSSDKSHTFFHGHSYTANPLACAAAGASLDLCAEPSFNKNLKRISHKHSVFSAQLARHPLAEHVRTTGTILAFDLKSPEGTSYLNPMRDRIYYFFMEQGILIRPLGNTIYLMPPYCITDEELDTVYNAIMGFLNEHFHRNEFYTDN
ncbi:MAG: adenosylmethionine--8-amino-7-oxononanoate aminotransferase BioA [Chitinophagales bacterium]|nr:MAG: adenosylmethionine--8-amino-7-oxononanoate aminotransferase BioA [Chitinophagales bacterium]